MIGVDNDDWSEGDDCDQLPLPPNRTVKEVAEALSVLEDFCEQIPHGACATEHLTAIRAIVAAQVRPKKQIRLQTSVTNKRYDASENFAFLLFIRYFDNWIIRQIFAIPPVSN